MSYTLTQIADAKNGQEKPSLVKRAIEYYFTPREFERNGRVYEALGILKLKKVFEFKRKIEYKNGRKPFEGDNYFIWDKSKEGLIAFEKRLRFNERIHLYGSLVGAIGIGLTDVCYGYNFPQVMLIDAVFLLNASLVMLQRYNRARLYNTIEKMEAREQEQKITAEQRDQSQFQTQDILQP